MNTPDNVRLKLRDCERFLYLTVEVLRLAVVERSCTDALVGQPPQSAKFPFISQRQAGLIEIQMGIPGESPHVNKMVLSCTQECVIWVQFRTDHPTAEVPADIRYDADELVNPDLDDDELVQVIVAWLTALSTPNPPFNPTRKPQ